MVASDNQQLPGQGPTGQNCRNRPRKCYKCQHWDHISPDCPSTHNYITDGQYALQTDLRYQGELNKALPLENDPVPPNPAISSVSKGVISCGLSLSNSSLNGFCSPYATTLDVATMVYCLALPAMKMSHQNTLYQ